VMFPNNFNDFDKRFDQHFTQTQKTVNTIFRFAIVIGVLSVGFIVAVIYFLIKLAGAL
jgi:hypothetical protein